MSARTPWLDRRRFLELATATTALCGVRRYATAADAATSTAPAGRALAASDVRTLIENLSGPEGPTMLADGRVAFIARPGNVIAVTPDGQAETLASSLGLIVGTALGRHEEKALYICRMDVSRMPRRAPGGAAAGPAGGPGPGGPPPGAPPGGPAGAGASPGGAQPGSILRLDLQTKAVTPLYTQWDGHPLAGPNKLVVDEWGDLWITDVFEGSLYWARTDGSGIRRVVSPLPGAHGITLSPDRRTVYVSSEDQLNAFSITGRGRLTMDGDSPRVKRVADLDGTRRPDGIRTVANGNILMACGTSLVELSPDGKFVSQTQLPDLRVSNFVFGGSKLRTIFATVNAAGTGTPGQTAGKVVSFAWPQAGLKPA